MKPDVALLFLVSGKKAEGRARARGQWMAGHSGFAAHSHHHWCPTPRDSRGKGYSAGVAKPTPTEHAHSQRTTGSLFTPGCWLMVPLNILFPTSYARVFPYLHWYANKGRWCLSVYLVVCRSWDKLLNGWRWQFAIMVLTFPAHTYPHPLHLLFGILHSIFMDLLKWRHYNIFLFLILKN